MEFFWVENVWRGELPGEELYGGIDREGIYLEPCWVIQDHNDEKIVRRK